MKKLIYSQEDLDLILSLEIEEKDEKIEQLSKNITNYEELLMQKNNIIDLAKEYIEKNYFKVGRIKELYEILDKEIK